MTIPALEVAIQKMYDQVPGSLRAEMIGGMRRLAAGGPLRHASLFSCTDSGVETVTFTYAVHVLFTVSPKIVDLATRAASIEKLEEQMKKKMKLPKEYKVFMSALAKGEDGYEAVRNMPAADVSTQAVDAE